MTPFDCPNCRGRGKVLLSMEGQGHPTVECPSCGGSGIDPELVEVAARYDDYLGHDSFEDMDYEERKWYEGMLAALVAYWKEKAR